MYVCMYEILFKRKESIDASLINYSWFPWGASIIKTVISYLQKKQKNTV